MKKLLFTLLFICTAVHAFSVEPPKRVYVFPIRENIMPSAVKLTDKCLRQAQSEGADLVVIDMNTYGGLLDAADSIRTRLLEYPLPVYTFVNNQAASAGALIALATDSIYMRPGASMGAATVVSQDGAALPDKYQSFMRGMMRSTAEAHGKRMTVRDGDTTWHWVRDPQIAQAMVDPGVVVPGLIDSTKVLTFTADEAMQWGYAEGKAASVEEILALNGIDNYEITVYKPTGIDRLLGFLTNPVFQGLMVMLIVGGLYFELQTPGVGFPLIASVAGALLYFAPLYVEGLVANWELIVFLAGIALVALEIFVTPGFGILGILGIAAIVLGLAFAVIDTSLLKYIPTGELSAAFIVQPIFVVIISVATSLILSIWLGRKFLTGRSALRERIVLVSDMNPDAGYISRPSDRGLVGSRGITATALRPAGKVRIGDRLYEASADNALFIDREQPVVIVRDEGGVLYCRIEGKTDGV